MMRWFRTGAMLMALSLSGCGGGKVVRFPLVRAWSEPYELTSRSGVELEKDRYGSLYGVGYDKEEIAPTDYDEIIPFPASKDLVLGRRHDTHKLDVILLRSRKILQTDFVEGMLAQNAYATVLFGSRAPDPKTGRQEVVVMDTEGKPWATLYAKKGATRVYLFGQLIVMDSVDDKGIPFSSLHDRHGMPISPRLAPLVHTQREMVGRYVSPVGTRVRLPARIAIRPGNSGVFDAPGNQPSIAIGRVPPKTKWDAFDRVIVRPILEDGTLAPIPNGALGFVPLNIAGDYWRNVVGALRHAPMHTQWCVVYPTATGFQFAIGRGGAAEVALQADAGRLPVYDELEFVAGTETVTEFTDERRPAGYVARLVSTGRWVHFDAETGEIVPRGDNFGQGFATGEEARFLRTKEEAEQRAKEEAEARQQALVKAALERARAERERAAWEADRPRREAEARARAEVLAKEQRRAEDELIAKVQQLPHFAAGDRTRRYYMDAQALRWKVSALRSPRVWEVFLTHYGVMDAACLVDARAVSVDAAVLAKAEQELRALNAAEDARMRTLVRASEPSMWDEMAKALDGMSRSSSVSPAGASYLQQVGYENIVKQNTQAWSNGANPWGRSWATK